jgi:hypothetical protein
MITTPTTLPRIIPSYLYEQYADDDSLQTFVAAQNIMAQWFLDWFTSINLPFYPGLSADLLNWVAAGLYGMARPLLTFENSIPFAGYASAPYNVIPYNAALSITTASFVPVTDDVFQRIMTWHLYRGDGFQYSTPWLKKRVHRFLNGPAGLLAINDTTQDVSVSYAGSAVTITLETSQIAQIFQFAVNDGVLALPFEYSYSVVLI